MTYYQRYLNNIAGIALAREIFSRFGLNLNPIKGIDCLDKQVIKTMAGILIQGRICFAEVDKKIVVGDIIEDISAV